MKTKDRIGFTVSTFDCLHVGHIAMLKEAKEVCDYLIVALLVDPTLDRPDTKNKPIQSVLERHIQLQAVKYIDEIIPVESELDIYNLLLLLQPDVRIIGEEYKGKLFTGSDLEIELHYNKRSHSFSTSELRERIANTVTKPTTFGETHV
jgi:glycerol-3-phosphate cytidylyltransferase